MRRPFANNMGDEEKLLTKVWLRPSDWDHQGSAPAYRGSLSPTSPSFSLKIFPTIK